MATSEEEAERIGNLLIEEGLITQEEIEAASKNSEVASSGLGGLLKRAVCVRRAELAAFVGTDYKILDVPNLSELEIPADALALVSGPWAEENQAFPLAKAGTILIAVAANPNQETVRALRQATGLRVKLLQAPAESVRSVIEARYKGAPAAPAKPASGVRPAPAAGGDKVAAVRVSAEEKAVVDLYIRLVTEWETTYTEARAVQAIKVA
jgi:hypothetical protein